MRRDAGAAVLVMLSVEVDFSFRPQTGHDFQPFVRTLSASLGLDASCPIVRADGGADSNHWQDASARQDVDRCAGLGEDERIAQPQRRNIHPEPDTPRSTRERCHH